MLRTFENTRPYAQPLAAISLSGECCALPPGFVEGLDFLCPFTDSKHHIMQWVHLLDGKLYEASNSLIVEYEIGTCDIEDTSFQPKMCRILAGFATPPEGVVIGIGALLFKWADGQELFVDRSGRIFTFNEQVKNMFVGAFKLHWTFGEGTVIDDCARKGLKRCLDGGGEGRDLYLDGHAVLTRNATRRAETEVGFSSNAKGLLRLDRKAFLAMIKVATEIDFTTSPVCFRHAHGRGMLVRRTIGHDVPTFGGGHG
jgi:hypothetical protein